MSALFEALMGNVEARSTDFAKSAGGGGDDIAKQAQANRARVEKAFASGKMEASEVNDALRIGDAAAVEAVIERKAVELSHSQNISKAAAYSRVLEVEPGLYNRFLQARGGI